MGHLITVSLLVVVCCGVALSWTEDNYRPKQTTRGNQRNRPITSHKTRSQSNPRNRLVIFHKTKQLGNRNTVSRGKLKHISRMSRPKETIDINWNGVIDLILKTGQKELKRLGMAEVALPNISQTFSQGAVVVTLTGFFSAEGGKFGNLASIKRVGDVIVRREDDVITLSVTLGLGEISMGYDHYTAGTSLASIGGNIKGTVGKNAIRTIAALTIQGKKCNIALKQVKVTVLEGLNIKLSGSGFGPLNWIITKVTNGFAYYFKDTITGKIESGLAQEIIKALEKFNCEEYIGVLSM